MMKKVRNKQALHVRAGDKVKVNSGKNKGKVGIIKTIIHSTSQVIIEGLNIKIKHIKRSRPNESGQIKELEFPIHSSNVSKYEE